MATAPLPHELRRCSRCSQQKPADHSHFSFISSKRKWHSWCKLCCAEQRREDRAKRPSHYAAVCKASRERNRDEFRRRVRGYYWRTREDRFDKEQARQRANRERYAENQRQRRQTDPAWAQRQRERAAAYRAAHREKHREYARRAWAKASVQRKVRNYFTAAICHSLNGRTKGGRSWESILGFSSGDLRAHLERQFERGMSWDNYGKWHVDHIIPVTAFCFETADDPEFRACWALTNLRPMWAAENIRKSNKRTHLL